MARMFSSRGEAVDSRRDLEKQIEVTHGGIQDGRKLTFSDLCRIAEKDFYGPAVIRGGRKRSGVKSNATGSFIKTLEEYFGQRKLSTIRKADLQNYKVWRYDKGDLRFKDAADRRPVSDASINREMVVMRRLLKHAFNEGWVTKDVFAGAGIIDRELEEPRERVLSDEEEATLLAACSGTHEISYKWHREGVEEREVKADIDRDHPELIAIILLAVDSGMRRGEILKLGWQDMDCTRRVITVAASHTKTERERLVPLTDRTIDALKVLSGFENDAGRVFSVTYIQRAWNTTRRIAGLEDLQFRDLRRTSGTRMELIGIPHAIVQKILGHAAADITGRHYIAATPETVQMVADKINARSRT